MKKSTLKLVLVFSLLGIIAEYASAQTAMYGWTHPADFEFVLPSGTASTAWWYDDGQAQNPNPSPVLNINGNAAEMYPLAGCPVPTWEARTVTIENGASVSFAGDGSDGGLFPANADRFFMHMEGGDFNILGEYTVLDDGSNLNLRPIRISAITGGVTATVTIGAAGTPGTFNASGYQAPIFMDTTADDYVINIVDGILDFDEIPDFLGGIYSETVAGVPMIISPTGGNIAMTVDGPGDVYGIRSRNSPMQIGTAGMPLRGSIEVTGLMSDVVAIRADASTVDAYFEDITISAVGGGNSASAIRASAAAAASTLTFTGTDGNATTIVGDIEFGTGTDSVDLYAGGASFTSETIDFNDGIDTLRLRGTLTQEGTSTTMTSVIANLEELEFYGGGVNVTSGIDFSATQTDVGGTLMNGIYLPTADLQFMDGEDGSVTSFTGSVYLPDAVNTITFIEQAGTSTLDLSGLGVDREGFTATAGIIDLSDERDDNLVITTNFVSLTSTTTVNSRVDFGGGVANVDLSGVAAGSDIYFDLVGGMTATTDNFTIGTTGPAANGDVRLGGGIRLDDPAADVNVNINLFTGLLNIDDNIDAWDVMNNVNININNINNDSGVRFGSVDATIPYYEATGGIRLPGGAGLAHQINFDNGGGLPLGIYDNIIHNLDLEAGGMTITFSGNATSHVENAIFRGGQVEFGPNTYENVSLDKAFFMSGTHSVDFDGFSSNGAYEGSMETVYVDSASSIKFLQGTYINNAIDVLHSGGSLTIISSDDAAETLESQGGIFYEVAGTHALTLEGTAMKSFPGGINFYSIDPLIIGGDYNVTLTCAGNTDVAGGVNFKVGSHTANFAGVTGGTFGLGVTLEDDNTLLRVNGVGDMRAYNGAPGFQEVEFYFGPATSANLAGVTNHFSADGQRDGVALFLEANVTDALNPAQDYITLPSTFTADLDANDYVGLRGAYAYNQNFFNMQSATFANKNVEVGTPTIATTLSVAGGEGIAGQGGFANMNSLTIVSGSKLSVTIAGNNPIEFTRPKVAADNITLNLSPIIIDTTQPLACQLGDLLINFQSFSEVNKDQFTILEATSGNHITRMDGGVRGDWNPNLSDQVWEGIFLGYDLHFNYIQNAAGNWAYVGQLKLVGAEAFEDITNPDALGGILFGNSIAGSPTEQLKIRLNDMQRTMRASGVTQIDTNRVLDAHGDLFTPSVAMGNYSAAVETNSMLLQQVSSRMVSPWYNPNSPEESFVRGNNTRRGQTPYGYGPYAQSPKPTFQMGRSSLLNVNSTWFQGFGFTQKQDIKHEFNGFSNEVNGFAAGIDRRGTSGVWLAGAAYAYTDSVFQSKAWLGIEDPNNSQTETHSLLGYFLLKTGSQMYMTAKAGYTWGAVDGVRRYTTANNDRIAYSTGTGTLFGQMTFAYQIGNEQIWQIVPKCRLSYYNFEQDGYTEIRPGYEALPAEVGKLQQDLYELDLVADLSVQPLDRVNLLLSLGYRIRKNSNGAFFNYAADGIGYGVNGISPSSDIFLLDLGGTLEFTDAIKFSGEYNYRGGNLGNMIHGLQGTLYVTL